MNLTEFFKTIGYDIGYVNIQARKLSNYLGWYKGFVQSFHRYYVYNGEKEVSRNRYSLNVPKNICETFADLLMNERIKVTLGTDEGTKIINDILQQNNFYVKANQGIEKTFALGTGCFLLSLDQNKNIKIQFVNAQNIYPLTYTDGEITECAFLSESTKFDKKTQKSQKIVDIQVHTLNEFGNYKIENFRFISGKNGNLEQIPIDDMFLVFETNSSYRWFMPIKPNICNNIDLKATLHKGRLTPLRNICRQIFRHTAQKPLEIQKYSFKIFVLSDKKYCSASAPQPLYSFASIPRLGCRYTQIASTQSRLLT